MQYKVTSKAIYCDYRCATPSILYCLECGKYVFDADKTEILTETQLVNKINLGNCIIIKVEVL